MNTINDRKTYVTVEEASCLLNRSERTIRRWIKQELLRVIRDEQTRSVRIDLDDIHRMQASKPDTVHPVHDAIKEVKRDNQELEQEVESLQQRVNSLKEQIERLLERQEVLEKRMDASQGRVSTGNLVLLPRHAPRASGAESRSLPADTQRLVHYASLHKANVSEIKGLHALRLIELTIHMREGEVKRNKQEWWITPEQQVQLVRYWQEHETPYTPCGECQGCMEQVQNSEIG